MSRLVWSAWLSGVGSRTHILRLAWLPLLLVPPLILCPKLLHHMSPLEGGVSLLMRFHVILQSPLLGWVLLCRPLHRLPPLGGGVALRMRFPFCPRLPWMTPSLGPVMAVEAGYALFLQGLSTGTARPLMHELPTWLERCSLPRWIFRILSQGYSLQFSRSPPMFAGMVETVLSSEVQNTALAREVAVLLVKGAVELVPPQCMMEGYYSRYFLVPR